jgi:predicted metal-dependent HD superfamily phosphohydrolase
MAAIALRDRWNLERIQVERAASEIEEALGRHDYRYSRRSKDDVKTSSLISARDLKRETDELAGKIRRLDLAIQMVNWSQDLPE